MNVIPTKLDGLLIIEPNLFGDQRGYFMETYQQERYREAGITDTFVQDNISFSMAGTLRGLHFQHPHGQAKLVQVLQGEVFDVAVDVRRNSSTFGQWVGVVLSDTNKKQLYIPAGFAHGFCVTGVSALFHYKCSDYYMPQNECGIIWNDPVLHIDWPVETPILSKRDQAFPGFEEIDHSRLPSF